MCLLVGLVLGLVTVSAAAQQEQRELLCLSCVPGAGQDIPAQGLPPRSTEQEAAKEAADMRHDLESLASDSVELRQCLQQEQARRQVSIASGWSTFQYARHCRA